MYVPSLNPVTYAGSSHSSEHPASSSSIFWISSSHHIYRMLVWETPSHSSPICLPGSNDLPRNIPNSVPMELCKLYGKSVYLPQALSGHMYVLQRAW